MTPVRTLPILLLAALSVSCQDPKKKASTSPSSSPTAAVKAEQADLPKLFCETIGNLSFRQDISSELRFYCEGKEASASFKNEVLIAESQTLAAGQKPEVSTLFSRNLGDNLTEIKVSWSYKVPVKPENLRQKKLGSFIARSFSSSTVDQTAAIDSSATDGFDSPLHFLSENLSFDISIKAPNNLTLSNARKSQYNLYQLKAAEERLGLGVEHLSDDQNPDYKRAVMINAVISDKDGSGAIIVSYLHFILNNQGFHSLAEQTVQQIAQNAASALYEGLR